MLIASLKGLKAKNTDLSQYWQENAITIDPLQMFDTTGKGGWFLGSPDEFALKKKIEQNGKPLKDWDIKINYGIKTGLNEAFIIDTATKERLCQQDPKSAEIIKPILRGRDIKRYGYKWADLWVINAHNGYVAETTVFPKNNNNKTFNNNGDTVVASTKILPIDINDYPAIKNHLDQFEPALSKRSDKGKTPYNLRHCAYLEEFQKEKVVYQEITQGSCFTYDSNGEFFVSNTGYLITGCNLKFLTGTLNSKLINFAYKQFYCTTLGENGVRWLKQHMDELPIPLLETPKKQDLAKQIEALVEEILRVKNIVVQTTVFPKNNPQLTADPFTSNETKQSGNIHLLRGQVADLGVVSITDLESQIDQLVYQLYDLSPEQIALVEGQVNNETYKKQL